MLRILHNGTVSGPILIDDIDDGLPNKQVHRLVGDPNAYARDGYANKPKQACYVPVGGFINLNETTKVTLSAAKGKIAGFHKAGLVNVVSISPDSVAQPTLSTAVLTGGNLTLTGTTFTSVAPDVTRVVVTGTGAATLTAADITAGSGTVGATSIVIPATLLPDVAVGTSSVQVVANSQSTTVVVVS